MNGKFSFSTCMCEYDAEEEKETSTVLEQIWAMISHFVQHNAAVLKKMTLLPSSVGTSVYTVAQEMKIENYFRL